MLLTPACGEASPGPAQEPSLAPKAVSSAETEAPVGERPRESTAEISEPASDPPARTPAREVEPGPSLTVATYNINFATKKLDEVVRLIVATDADVVAIQELTARARPVLARRTAEAYPHAHFEPAKWAGGHAFLSRTPLRDVAVVEAKHGPFGALRATTDHDGRAVQLLSVHLDPTLPRRGASEVEVIGAFVANEDIRLRELEALLGELDPALPHVILGDFNSPPLLPVALRMAREGYVDSQGRDPAHRDEPTWHWRWQGSAVTLRIDYVFHSPALATRSSRVLAEGPSDHYPVVSRLTWQPD